MVAVHVGSCSLLLFLRARHESLAGVQQPNRHKLRVRLSDELQPSGGGGGRGGGWSQTPSARSHIPADSMKAEVSRFI